MKAEDPGKNRLERERTFYANAQDENDERVYIQNFRRIVQTAAEDTDRNRTRPAMSGLRIRERRPSRVSSPSAGSSVRVDRISVRCLLAWFRRRFTGRLSPPHGPDFADPPVPAVRRTAGTVAFAGTRHAFVRRRWNVAERFFLHSGPLRPAARVPRSSPVFGQGSDVRQPRSRLVPTGGTGRSDGDRAAFGEFFVFLSPEKG